MEWVQIQIFYNGLNNTTKKMLDAASRSSLCSKKPHAAYSLIKEMANNSCQWSSERNILVKEASIYQVDAITTLAAQVEAITKRMDIIQSISHAFGPSNDSWGPQSYPGCSSSSDMGTGKFEQVDFVR